MQEGEGEHSKGQTNTPSSVAELPLELREKIRDNVRLLSTLDIDTTLQAEIVAHLLDGRKTPAQLAELLFESQGEGSSSHPYYMRVSRALQVLESRGYVSRRLFGSHKPYRLTRYALAMLASLDETGAGGLVGRWDMALFLATGICAVFTISANQGYCQLGRFPFMVLYTVFLLLSGMSLLRFLEKVRRVW